MYKEFKKEIQLADGRSISIETGKLAKQADGSVIVRMGKTMILAAVVSAKDAKDNVDFMPLSVDYQEKYYSTGRFPGGFLKREGRPGDSEILVSRLVDRVLRPLFPSDYHADTFVNLYLISADGVDMPDALAGLAASAALAVSDIPFHGPISEVRVARVNGEFIVNPTFEQNKLADIDIMVGATEENIMMVEGEMNEVSEAEMLEALKIAHDSIKIACKAQKEFAEEVGSTVKREYCHENNDDELRQKTKDFSYDKIYEVAKSASAKHVRAEAFAKIKEEFIESLALETMDENTKSMIDRYYHDVEKEAVRKMILKDKQRLDGRETTEIRPIWSEIDYLPAAHGSAIFTRGETQSLTSVTLGSKREEKIVDGALDQSRDRFLLHYNFPPFSTGDARAVRGVGRREVGHGNLALRALKPMIPEDFPYTIRIVSEILESNGSSSMATVCAGTLALMDTGVQMKKPVSGIAMGLITDNKDFVILSDILGDEDHLGDMDFKVTGTKDGITACQMDIKVDGLSYEILEKALEQAKAGRLHILGKILETIAEPRAEYKSHTPRIETIKIPKDMIGSIIGPGGKIIQQIQEETGTDISIDEANGVGTVAILAPNGEAIEKAMAWVKGIIAVPEVGDTYKGKVVEITSFGAFVEILPGKSGLLHISEIEWRRLATVEEVLKEGDVIDVKLLEVDSKTGKLRLSRKALLEKPEGFVEETQHRRSFDRNDRGRDNRRRDDRRGGRDDRRRDDRRGGRDDRGRDDRKRY